MNKKGLIILGIIIAILLIGGIGYYLYNNFQNNNQNNSEYESKRTSANNETNRK